MDFLGKMVAKAVVKKAETAAIYGVVSHMENTRSVDALVNKSTANYLNSIKCPIKVKLFITKLLFLLVSLIAHLGYCIRCWTQRRRALSMTCAASGLFPSKLSTPPQLPCKRKGWCFFRPSPEQGIRKIQRSQSLVEILPKRRLAYCAWQSLTLLRNYHRKKESFIFV